MLLRDQIGEPKDTQTAACLVTSYCYGAEAFELLASVYWPLALGSRASAARIAQLDLSAASTMSQETAAVRLNADVWLHTAAMLGDPMSLCALEAVSRELLTLVRKSEVAWCAVLANAASPVLAAAFVKAAPGVAKSLYRGWLQRWRAQPRHPSLAFRSWYPILCVPWGGDCSGPFTESAPRVIFEVSDDDESHAGVMVWDGLLADGQVDEDRSLVFVPQNPLSTFAYDAITDRRAGITTSCFVVDERTGAMIELWRDQSDFQSFDQIGDKRATMSHGCVELLCVPQTASAAQVVNEIRSASSSITRPPEGVDFMSLLGYVRFKERPRVDEDAHRQYYQILDLTVSIGVNAQDTLQEFDDLARMLTSALAWHNTETLGQGVFRM